MSPIWPSCAPAFIFTAPPSVAGMATPNSSPLSPCRSATPASAGSGIAAPARTRSRSRAAQRYPFPSRITSPGNPSCDTSVFDPLPVTVAHLSTEEGHDVGPMREVHGPRSRGRELDALDDQLAGHPRDRVLRGSVDVRDDDEIRLRNARAQLAPERANPPIAMRLHER